MAATPRRPFLTVSLLTWAASIAAQCIYETSRWSSPLSGVANGIGHLPLITVLFGILIMPLLGLLWVFLSFLQVTMRWKLAWALVPAMVLLGSSLTAVVFFPVDSRDRFYHWTGTVVPASAVDFRAFHSGGWMRDYFDVYYFEAESEAVTALLTTGLYERTDDYPISRRQPLPIGTLPSGWPNPTTWDGVEVYRQEHTWGVCLLVTDSSRSRVMVIATAF